MTLSDYDSNEDADYAPSDSDGSSDELEYDSGASVSSASEAVESDGEGLAAEEWDASAEIAKLRLLCMNATPAWIEYTISPLKSFNYVASMQPWLIVGYVISIEKKRSSGHFDLSPTFLYFYTLIEWYFCTIYFVL